MMLRSIELALPDPAAAARFMVDIWGMANAAQRGPRLYLRGSGPLPYLVGLSPSPDEFVRSVTFTCTAPELSALTRNIVAACWPAAPVESSDPGGGHGIVVELPEGEIFRFLTDSATAPSLVGSDLPAKLAHVVFNSNDAEQTGHAAEDVLGFRVSDRTRGMVFVRCNQSHHATAFARAGYSSLNHIAFEMEDIDAVMRGIGRLRDHAMVPAWGPGRHGPGANVYAYYVAPFGPVIEFSTAVELLAEGHQVGTPEDWTWPANRIDRWGISDKDIDALAAAEKRFKFRREWNPAPLL